MKSGEFVQRLERAGWKRVRSEGSHFTFQRGKERVVYHYGRPQTELGKAKLKELMRAFHLKETEAEMAVARARESNRVSQQTDMRYAVAVAQTEVKEPHLNSELSYGEMHLLFAQLNRDHDVTLTTVSRATGIAHMPLMDYMHHQKSSLNKAQLTQLRDWFLEQEVRKNLTRDRAELMKRGYGARTGSTNRRDPRLARIALALKATGRSYTELNEEIFGDARGGGIVGSVVRGKVKRVFPESMEKLEAWYEAYLAAGKAEAQIQTTTESPVRGPVGIAKEQPFGTPVVAKAEIPTQKPIVVTGGWEEFLEPHDKETNAVKQVWEAIRNLDPTAATRVLNYTLNRIKDAE